MKKGLAIVFAAGAAAVFAVSCHKARAVADRLNGIAGDLRSLENDVDSLDERTDGMEFDLKYNVKRYTDYDIDDYYDDDKY